MALRRRRIGVRIPDTDSAPAHRLLAKFAKLDLLAIDTGCWPRSLLREHGFDDFAEAQCATFYAEMIGRPGLPPGIYFRLLLIGPTHCATPPLTKPVIGAETSAPPVLRHARA